MTKRYNMRLQEAALVKMYYWGEVAPKKITLRDKETNRVTKKVIYHSK